MLKKRKAILLALLLVLPALLIRGFTTVQPIFMTFYNSLFDLSLFKGGTGDFIGLQNYKDIFTDDKFITSTDFTVIFTVISMIFHIILGVGLALLLNMKFKGKKFLRVTVLIPWAMPMVVAGQAARWAFNDMYGLVNDLIRRVNPGFHFDWLIHNDSARMAVIAVDLWKDVPFFAILVLAALQFIPGDIYESAKIDGAGKVRAFFSITVPNITKTVITISIFFTMWRLTSFDVVYAMTSGGPGDSTTLLSYRIMIEAFTNLNLGYASAIGVVLFVVMLLFSGVNLFVIKRINARDGL